MYYLRLDDAAEYLNLSNWIKIEIILNEYGVKPLVGVIPNVKDKDILKYDKDGKFWERVENWRINGWEIALHGYDHVCITESGGINPINKRSEFAAVPYEIQKYKIERGVEILRSHGINPKIFFAPSHTFDLNTIQVIKECTDILVISDTIANDVYTKYDITFVPQQSGKVRYLPMKSVTFCYHPNTMQEADFEELKQFLNKNSLKFGKFPVRTSSRKENWLDILYKKIYFLKKLILV